MKTAALLKILDIGAALVASKKDKEKTPEKAAEVVQNRKLSPKRTAIVGVITAIAGYFVATGGLTEEQAQAIIQVLPFLAALI